MQQLTDYRDWFDRLDRLIAPYSPPPPPPKWRVAVRPAAPPQQPHPVLVLDGEVHHVDVTMVTFFQGLLEVDGHWRSGSDLRNAYRILQDLDLSRLRNRLPRELRDLVESNAGKGYRLSDTTAGQDAG